MDQEGILRAKVITMALLLPMGMDLLLVFQVIRTPLIILTEVAGVVIVDKIEGVETEVRRENTKNSKRQVLVSV